MEKRKKIYCYVDETGQDISSPIFIVVAVIVGVGVDDVRSQITKLESLLKVGSKKWHKLRHKDRVGFIKGFLEQKNNNLKIYFGEFKKPIPSFFPYLEVVQKSLKDYSDEPFEAIISVDGLDTISAKKLTNALRTKFFSLRLVKGVRDESEVMIRLADRWAGCLRLASLKDEQCKELVISAKRLDILREK